MLRLYSVNGNCINTASTTLPLANIVATAAILPEILEVVLGSDAVASNAAKYAFQRGTSVGTCRSRSSSRLASTNGEVLPASSQ